MLHKYFKPTLIVFCFPLQWELWLVVWLGLLARNCLLLYASVLSVAEEASSVWKLVTRNLFPRRRQSSISDAASEKRSAHFEEAVSLKGVTFDWEKRANISRRQHFFILCARQPPPHGSNDARCRHEKRKVFRKACLFFIYGREDLFFTQHLLEISALAMHCTHKKWKDKDAPAPAPFCFCSTHFQCFSIFSMYMYMMRESISSPESATYISNSNHDRKKLKCFFPLWSDIFFRVSYYFKSLTHHAFKF
jgi:hypothetical protein